MFLKRAFCQNVLGFPNDCCMINFQRKLEYFPGVSCVTPQNMLGVKQEVFIIIVKYNDILKIHKVINHKSKSSKPGNKSKKPNNRNTTIIQKRYIYITGVGSGGGGGGRGARGGGMCSPPHFFDWGGNDMLGGQLLSCGQLQ